jgi:alginate O-acetyltransferase complex protein AlgI
MLFNSYPFILVFLPATAVIYYWLRRAQLDRPAVAFLAAASLFFYGWWNPIYLVLLGALILGNFFAVRVLIAIPLGQRKLRKVALIAGVAGNLLVLGYFKYANFFVDNINALSGVGIDLLPVVLPLGISFFTFQKIALLADTYQGKVKELNFLDYVLFVSFFPQLIAGPIVHHSEVMPQFGRRGRVGSDSLALGAAIFSIGLFKKVLLADSLALYATPQFDAASSGVHLGALAAWTGALAYTLQLYFDFSGYSDMAIGAGLLFGIRLPVNFASPYKAANIIEFWRCWHMTLSRFLRDYLYIPLGGNRHGPARRYINLFLTMLLGGLWHGAAWTFVFWGALHGTYLAINHCWTALRMRLGGTFATHNAGARLAGHAITFIAVVIGWVFFRSDSFASASAMLAAMAGTNGLGMGDQTQAWWLLLPSLMLVWIAPNTQEITSYTPSVAKLDEQRPRKSSWPRWRPSTGWAAICGSLFAVSLLSLSKISEFLYFQF